MSSGSKSPDKFKQICKQAPLPLIATIIALTAFHFLYNQVFLSLPLRRDEWLYANPANVENLANWYKYSYGHPPGWQLLLGIYYGLAGYSPFNVHVFALFLSQVYLWVIFAFVYTRQGIIAAICAVTVLYSLPAVNDGATSAHPVFIAFSAGLASLWFAHQKRYFPATVLLTLSILLRESCLVFALAILFVSADRGRFFSALVATGVWFGTVLWQHLATVGTNSGLANPAYKNAGATLPSLWDALSLQTVFQLTGEYLSFLITNSLLVLIVTTILSSVIFVIFRRHFPLHKQQKPAAEAENRMPTALTIVFIGHAAFFAIVHNYYQGFAPRDGTVAGTALILVCLELIHRTATRHKNHIWLACLTGTLIFTAHDVKLSVNQSQAVRMAGLYRNLGSRLQELTIQHDYHVAMSTATAVYMQIPAIGYVEKPISVRAIVLANAAVRSLKDIGMPDLIVDESEVRLTEGTGNLRRLLENSSSYGLAETVQYGTAIQRGLNIWHRVDVAYPELLKKQADNMPAPPSKK